MRGSATAPTPLPKAGRPSRRRTAGAVAAAALLLPLLGAAPGAQAAEGPLSDAFARAAAEYEVPRSVLLGVSYLESRWDAHAGLPSVSGGYGPMHLTDLSGALAEAPHHSDGAEDPRGDEARPLVVPEAAGAEAPEASELPARLRTLDAAAELTGLPADELREDPAANVEGGAALLARTQRELGQPFSDDPADWYAAVARYSGAQDSATAAMFAQDVFSVISAGQERVTDTGERIVLTADPRAVADPAQLERAGLRKLDQDGTECPATLACEWIPAPYEHLGGDDPGNYGNHDLANRPEDQSIDYIVVHSTEATWDTTLMLVQRPNYLAWHYSIRSSDGHVAQHVKARDVGWHAGNWYVNAHSIGVEQEAFLAQPDAWFTESLYRSSARLVKYLAKEHDVPLDRQHILSHDAIPGVTAANIPGMHTDPGPYWDWAHYFQLMGASFHQNANPHDDVVTIRPDYASNQPVYTGCERAGVACAPHGSSEVRLYSAPSEDAPLVKDIGLYPKNEGRTTIGVNDVGARASTGQQFVVAERAGDWTAIWYLGQKAWFRNPAEQRTAVPTKGLVVTPKAGRESVPVYGRAYPEASAYPAGVPVQALAPLPYRFEAGQRYVAGDRFHPEYFWNTTYGGRGTVVRGQDDYYQIQLGHRVAFVKASDVDVVAR
ncbi:N-acetylmuramoyl-L-alanine amidase [Streptomyces sp. NPDC002734]|uniref:N-acetylmuramoyl-L-alanine amidase n=1 Tax=Streptomyces sp. NPDC002734 TaxID=3154426 RepID=UPI00331C5572